MFDYSDGFGFMLVLSTEASIFVESVFKTPLSFTYEL